MSGTVLLARPHPFIVTAMGPFLRERGLTPVKPEGPDRLADQARDAVGVVISMAVTSDIPLDPGGVLARVREGNPDVPVLFAALLDFAQVERNVLHLLEQQQPGARVYGVHSDSAVPLGRPSAALYLSRADLEDAGRRATAARMIDRHFL
ncbi:MAG: hypothetical protein ACQETK_01065 [Pseudomonadota bacterium]